MARPAMFEFDNSRRDDFVTLMRNVFSAESAARKAVAWDWLFKKPDPSGARTFGRGTQKDGSLVGACLILPYTLWIDGQESPSWWPSRSVLIRAIAAQACRSFAASLTLARSTAECPRTRKSQRSIASSG